MNTTGNNSNINKSNNIIDHYLSNENINNSNENLLYRNNTSRIIFSKNFNNKKNNKNFLNIINKHNKNNSYFTIESGNITLGSSYKKSLPLYNLDIYCNDKNFKKRKVICLTELNNINNSLKNNITNSEYFFCSKNKKKNDNKNINYYNIKKNYNN